DRQVGYYVPGHDKSLYFTAGGVTFALAGKSSDRRRPTTETRRLTTDDRQQPVVMPASFTRSSRLSAPHPQSEGWAVRLEFVGARAVRPAGRKPTSTVVSYFTG